MRTIAQAPGRVALARSCVSLVPTRAARAGRRPAAHPHGIGWWAIPSVRSPLLRSSC